MTTIQELNPHNFQTNKVIDKNLSILFMRLNELQCAYGHDLELSSGLRSEALQAELIAQGRTQAVNSAHLGGCAADIKDPEGLVGEWVMNHLSFMEKIGLWVEDTRYTKGWVHVQIYSPISLNRVFIP